MAKDFFSLPEAAAILGISRIAVFKKVRKGQVAAIRVGRNWAIAASVLNSYNEKSANPPPPAAKPPAKHHETKTVTYSPSPDAEMSDMGWD
ncbi:MAG: helix-turn-helix domain-containing protein [Elusimicrobia bacterium]|nr:helix-turn-helix domain-containing protein [Elusimicrobiota bacterium]